MNFLRNSLFTLAAVLLVSSFAFAFNAIDPNCLFSNELTVLADNTIYNVQRGHTIEVDFFVNNCTNKVAVVLSQIKYDEEEEMDYFDPTFSSKSIIVPSKKVKKITYKIKIDEDTPAGEYKLTFVFYNLTTEITKEITIVVDDFDDFDITLEKSTFCKKEPLETYLIFHNDTGHIVEIYPKVTSDELWPKVHSDSLVLEDNKDTKVKISFNKDVPIGKYTLKIENNIVIHDKGPEYFRKDLQVEVIDCLSKALELDVVGLVGSITKGENKEIIYTLHNNSEEDILVQFAYENTGGDYFVSQLYNDAIVEAGSSISNTLFITTNDNTLTGVHSLKIKVYSPHQLLEKTLNFNVVSGKIEISYDPISAKNSLKNVQKIKVKNSSTEKKEFFILVENKTTDIVYPEISKIVVEKGSVATLNIFIIPHSTGVKTYKLTLKNDKELYSKDIYYNSVGYYAIPTFITKYTSKISTEKNSSFNITVDLENPYDIPIDLSLYIESGTGAITSVTRALRLAPQEKKTVDVPVFVTSAIVGEYSVDLVTLSDVGVTRNPVFIKVLPTEAEIMPLEVEFPENIYYIPGETTMVPLKIKNNNPIDITNAKIYFDENTGITTNIGANSVKDIKVPLYLEGIENQAVKLTVATTDSKVDSYDVLAEPNPRFVHTGLFGLGLGSTIGIIIGIIIVVLIILIVVFSKNNKKAAQEEEANTHQTKL